MVQYSEQRPEGDAPRHHAMSVDTSACRALPPTPYFAALNQLVGVGAGAECAQQWECAAQTAGLCVPGQKCTARDASLQWRSSTAAECKQSLSPSATRVAGGQCSSDAAALAQRKDRASGTLIFTVVSQGHLLLLANFVAALARIGLSDSVGVGCLDAPTAKLLHAAFGETCLTPADAALPPTMGPFQRMGMGKHLLLEQLLSCDLTGVLLVDTDAIFTSSAASLSAWLPPLTGGADVFSSTAGLPAEASSKWGFALNIGWTWLRADARVQRWVKKSGDHLLRTCLVPQAARTGSTATAQVSFNLLLLEQNMTWFRTLDSRPSQTVSFGVCEGEYAGLRIATIPTQLVPRPECLKKGSLQATTGVETGWRALNVHCNARDHEKVASMKRAQVWFLDASISDDVGVAPSEYCVSTVPDCEMRAAATMGNLSEFVRDMQQPSWRLKLARFGLETATPFHKSKIKNFDGHIEHFGGQLAHGRSSHRDGRGASRGNASRGARGGAGSQGVGGSGNASHGGSGGATARGRPGKTEHSSAPATAVPDIAALLDQPGGFERAIKAVKARASGGGMELAEYARFATHVREHAPMNLLVWGLGYDSTLWTALNRGGRTMVLEGNHLFLKGMGFAGFGHPAGARVEGRLTLAAKSAPMPGLERLEVHHFFAKSFNTSVATYQKFIRHPHRAPTGSVPDELSTVCWDTVLVDSPVGARPDAVSRAVPMYDALEAARPCLASGKLKEAWVWVHDCSRGSLLSSEASLSFGILGESHLVSETGAKKLRAFRFASVDQ